MKHGSQWKSYCHGDGHWLGCQGPDKSLTPFSHLRITSHRFKSHIVKRMTVYDCVGNSIFLTWFVLRYTEKKHSYFVWVCVYQTFLSASQSAVLSYLMLKPAAERLLSVVNNRNRKLDVEIRKWGAWVPWYSPISGEEAEGPSLISSVS